MSLFRLCICMALGLTFCGEPAAFAAALTVELQTVDMHYPVFVPPPAPAAVTPALKEERFPLERAVNFQEMASNLNPEQKKYLEEHRFLLLPASAFAGDYDEPPDVCSPNGFFNEMLSMFWNSQLN